MWMRCYAGFNIFRFSCNPQVSPRKSGLCSVGGKDRQGYLWNWPKQWLEWEKGANDVSRILILMMIKTQLTWLTSCGRSQECYRGVSTYLGGWKFVPRWLEIRTQAVGTSYYLIEDGL